MSNHHNIDDFGDRIGDIANPIVIEVEDMSVTFNSLTLGERNLKYKIFKHVIYFDTLIMPYSLALKRESMYIILCMHPKT